MICTLVPADHVRKIWLKVLPHVRVLVDEAEGRLSEMDMYEEMISGKQILWVAAEPVERDDGSQDFDVLGFITTKINRYAKITMASLEYCSGVDADTWFMDLMAVIEKWAKQVGCDGIEMVCGRRGWTRKFKRAGFRDKFTWAEKRFYEDSEDGKK